MFSFIVIVLIMLGAAQVAGGLLGTFVAISGLRRIKANAASSPGGIVTTAQVQGQTILRRSALALVLGFAVLAVAFYVAAATA